MITGFHTARPLQAAKPMQFGHKNPPHGHPDHVHGPGCGHDHGHHHEAPAQKKGVFRWIGGKFTALFRGVKNLFMGFFHQIGSLFGKGETKAHDYDHTDHKHAH